MARRSISAIGVKANLSRPKNGWANLSDSVQDHILAIYSIVKIVTEKVSIHKKIVENF